METLGTKLKAARQKRKLSASEAASGTRIKVQHIEAIEQDDFSSIAAPTYAKGFIRIYAEFLGMNPEPLIEEYTATHMSQPRASLIPEDPQPPQAAPKERKPLPRPTLPKVDWKAISDKIGLQRLCARIRNIRWQPSPAMLKTGLAGLALVLIVAMAVVVLRRDRSELPEGREEPGVVSPADPVRDHDRPVSGPGRPLPVIHALPEPYLE